MLGLGLMNHSNPACMGLSLHTCISHFIDKTNYSNEYFSLSHVEQSEGTLLATGSYDGFARIWTKDGELH